jgi:hypothetical protein
MRIHAWSAALVTLVSLSPASSAAHAAKHYQLTTIDHPDAFGLTYALGIDDRGDVSGAYLGADWTLHGYLLHDGVYQAIEYPGSTLTVCAGHSDARLMAGTYKDTEGFQHGFLWNDGQFTAVDYPGAAQTTGIDFDFGPGLGTALIRVVGQRSVGVYADASGAQHGFLLHHGAFTPIDVPGQVLAPGWGTAAFALNSKGAVAGSYFSGSSPPIRGYVLEKGVYRTFDVPGAGGSFGTQVNGMNDSGVLVGPYSDGDDVFHGFIDDHGDITTIDVPGAVFTEIDSINNHGAISGEWVDPGGVWHAFVGVPQAG